MAEFGKEAGRRLRAAREGLGFSQFDAAVRLGVTEKTVGKWERAESKPTRRGHWEKIEEVYGVTTREILGEPEPAQLDRIEAMLERLLAAVEPVSLGEPPEGPLRQLAESRPNSKGRGQKDQKEKPHQAQRS